MLPVNGVDTYLGGAMRRILCWFLAGVLGAFFLVVCDKLVELASGAAHKQKVQTEECIYLKYKKDAEKFLDKDCQRYVRYKQDN